MGQEPIARTLRNAIASGRVAHAYLFTGPRGVGKTSMARIFAMALNCGKSEVPTADPCGECPACKAIFQGEDVDVLEIDGASNNGVEHVRTLRDNVGYHPAHGRFKIYIIDEVHMLTKEAFNALLKTLEEPPPHVKFIFATTEPNKLPDTIVSRCQRFDFRAISTDDIVRRLVQITQAEKVKASEEVLRTLARRARGGMRDSQSLLDQIVAYNPEEVTPEAIDFVLGRAFDDEIDKLFESFIAKEAGVALEIVARLIAEGQDLTEFLAQLVEAFRALMVLKATKGDPGKPGLLELAPERLARLAKFSEAFSMDSILYMIQVTADADRRTRTAVEKRVVVETTMVKLATMEDLRPLSEIVERLKAIESSAPAAHAPVRPAAPAPRSPAPYAAPPRREPPRRVEPAPVEVEEDMPPVPEAESAPALEPVPVVTASGPLGEVQALWPRLIALVKTRGGASLAAWFKEGSATSLAENELTVSFPAAFEFHRQQVSDPARLLVVEGCLAEVAGRKIRIRISGKEAAKSAVVPGQATAASARGSGAKAPGVQRAMEIFGGRVLDEGK